MEPLSPQDPIKHLLADAREVPVRPNFAQNVLRAARQTPQDRGLFAALRAWWEEKTTPMGLGLAGGALAALVLGFALLSGGGEPSASSPTVAKTAPIIEKVTPVAADMPLLPVAEAELEAPFDTEALFAVQDASELSDSQISFLLY